MGSAAELVATKRRHTHFTVDQLIDARVSGEVIELYRALIAETSARRRKPSVAKPGRRVESTESDILPGSVSRLDAFIPDRLAQIEHLYGDLLAQTEARHKAEMEKLSAHLAHSEELHKAQVKELTTHLAETEARHKSQVEELVARYSTEAEELKLQIARQEGHYTAELEVLQDQFAQANARHQTEAEQLRDRITQLNRLLHHRSVNLAEDERYIGELTDRLRKQLWNTRRLSRLLEDTEKASERLNASRRWKL